MNVTPLGFSGSANNWAVTASAALADNRLYDGRIVVRDDNGVSTTNTFSLNTWRPDNPFIEAEDYNYNRGHFMATGAFPDAYG